MDQIFKEHLAKLPFFLFPDGEVQPKLLAGKKVLAGNLADFVEIYVNLLNSDKTLSAQSMFQVLPLRFYSDNVLHKLIMLVF